MTAPSFRDVFAVLEADTSTDAGMAETADIVRVAQLAGYESRGSEGPYEMWASAHDSVPLFINNRHARMPQAVALEYLRRIRNAAARAGLV